MADNEGGEIRPESSSEVVVKVVGLGTNISSLMAQRRLNESTSAGARTFERLSTGRRINRGADDAAGLTIAATLNAKTRIQTQAMRNINDGISAVTLGQSALSALTEITIRQKELATQAANGTYSAGMREAVNKEAEALTQEYSRILATTTFNNKPIFSSAGTDFALQAEQGANQVIQTTLGAELVSSQSEVTTIDFAGTAAAGVAESTTIAINNYFLNTTAETQYIAVSGGVSSGLSGGDYISFSYNGQNYYVWFSVDASGSDPALSGATGIMVSVDSWVDTDESIADKIASALSTNSINNGRIGGGSPEWVTVTSTQMGNQSDPYVSSGGGIFAYVSSDGRFVGDIMELRDANNNQYYVYYNTDPGGYTGTGIQVNLAADDSDLDIAQKTAAAVAATGVFSASTFDFGGQLYLSIQNVAAGNVLNTSLGGSNDLLTFDSSTNGRLLLSGQNYFTFSTATGDYYAWFNDGLSTNPSLSGKTGIQITGVSGGSSMQSQTPSLLATRAKVALDAALSGQGITTQVSGGVLTIRNSAVGARTDATISVAGASLSIQQGATASMEPESINLTTASGAQAALTVLDQRQSRLIKEQAAQGAFESRLRTALAVLGTTRENYAAAESRIMDADIAQEVSSMVRTSTLQRVGTAILAQANQQPAMVLQLLRD